ncbi:MAG: hypothetical protein HY549_01375 [Elusimicrobia bacterium]|nr:hypothetical protein [Elusimicrobiota bacterium]
MRSVARQPQSDGYLATVAASFDYPMQFTRDAFSPTNADFLNLVRRREPARRHRLFVVVDSGVALARPELCQAVVQYARQFAASLDLAAPPLVIEGGEASKSRPELWSWFQARLCAANLDRQSHLVVVGGGALQDMAGYSAAALYGGLRLFRMPSTVVSQAEAGMVWRSSLNAFGKKDLLSQCYPPSAILLDTELLKSVAPKEKLLGAIEALKIALVRDPDFFHWLADRARLLAVSDPKSIEAMVRWSARLHLESMAEGENPFAPSLPLACDLGHWAAHRAEELLRPQVGYGECAAIGLAVDLLVSREALGLPAETVAAAIHLMEELGLRLWHPSLEQHGLPGRLGLLEGLEDCRRRWPGPTPFLLLRELGEPVWVASIEEGSVGRAVEFLKSRSHTHPD